MTSYPRQDGSTLQAWASKPLDTHEWLAEQVPHRLQRLMYESNAVDVDGDAFAAHAAAADIRLRELLRDEPRARAYFNGWTFAAVVDTTDRMRAAEAEYYLCDALIEYGNQFHRSPGQPVLDTSLKGLYEAERPA
ncbi:hypothetical protein KZO11_20175 [Streptomyces anulatus]|uniref:hypothetical protein n=1 Tax=Streptomyces anulatus TaxID=1892 RepID=UPI001C5CFCF5|nr:hypothetical protein [Streptomyces anulatus]QYA95801.1 hypothetical protein KZO11_20175 [Streptomyces anulatus]